MTDQNDVFRRGEAIYWPGSTSPTLLERLWTNEPTAWDEFVDRYAPAVFRWCRHFGLSSEDSADIAQEVFLNVSRKISQFDYQSPNASFRGWLWTLTRNKTVDFIRRQRGLPVGVGGSTTYERITQIPDSYEEYCERDPDEREGFRQMLQDSLESVRIDYEDNTWKAFWRTAVDGLAPADVAEELGVSVNAVYLSRSRILRRLREELGHVPSRDGPLE